MTHRGPIRSARSRDPPRVFGSGPPERVGGTH